LRIAPKLEATEGSRLYITNKLDLSRSFRKN
jgi:hypothetical protein